MKVLAGGHGAATDRIVDCLELLVLLPSRSQVHTRPRVVCFTSRDGMLLARLHVIATIDADEWHLGRLGVVPALAQVLLLAGAAGVVAAVDYWLHRGVAALAQRVLGVLDSGAWRGVLVMVRMSAVIGAQVRVEVQVRRRQSTLFKVFLLNDRHGPLHPLAYLLRLLKLLIVLSVNVRSRSKGSGRV